MSTLDVVNRTCSEHFLMWGPVNEWKRPEWNEAAVQVSVLAVFSQGSSKVSGPEVRASLWAWGMQETGVMAGLGPSRRETESEVMGQEKRLQRDGKRSQRCSQGPDKWEPGALPSTQIAVEVFWADQWLGQIYALKQLFWFLCGEQTMEDKRNVGTPVRGLLGYSKPEMMEFWVVTEVVRINWVSYTSLKLELIILFPEPNSIRLPSFFFYCFCQDHLWLHMSTGLNPTASSQSSAFHTDLLRGALSSWKQWTLSCFPCTPLAIETPSQPPLLDLSYIPKPRVLEFPQLKTQSFPSTFSSSVIELVLMACAPVN